METDSLGDNVTVDNLSTRVKSLKDEVRIVDKEASDMLRIVESIIIKPDGSPMEYLQDARDHLHQVHMLLTSIKGHLGAVNYAVKQQEDKDKTPLWYLR